MSLLSVRVVPLLITSVWMDYPKPVVRKAHLASVNGDDAGVECGVMVDALVIAVQEKSGGVSCCVPIRFCEVQCEATQLVGGRR